MKRPKRRPKTGLRKRGQKSAGANIQCPTCFETIWIAFDAGGNTEQTFSYDCEVCCRPMTVHIRRDESGEIFGRAELES